MDIEACVRRRYATKKFIVGKKIPAHQVQAMRDMLRLSASSVNAQPWHFIMASTPEGKCRIAESTEGVYVFNRDKIREASHVIVFCARQDLSDSYLEELSEQEWQDGRYETLATKEDMHAKRQMFIHSHKTDLEDLSEWIAKQVYLSLGSFLVGVSALGLDAVPIEGFHAHLLDEVLNLGERSLKSLAIVAVGYRSEEDMNAQLPKSRLPEAAILTEL